MCHDEGPPAVLFDVDGTLIDSNYLHVHAWFRAFAGAGLPVEAWRIHRCIGMDGSKLITALARDASAAVRRRLTDRHSRYYRQTSDLLTVLPGARELLRHLASCGLQVVLASSAPEDELALARHALDCDDVIAAATSSRDVDTAKPEPDIVAVALDRARVGADNAVFVGDAVWDVVAANRAGVTCIGLCSGGVSAAELRDAGAAAVFDNPEDLLKNIAGSPIALLTRS